LPKTTKQLLTF